MINRIIDNCKSSVIINGSKIKFVNSTEVVYKIYSDNYHLLATKEAFYPQSYNDFNLSSKVIEIIKKAIERPVDLTINAQNLLKWVTPIPCNEFCNLGYRTHHECRHAGCNGCHPNGLIECRCQSFVGAIGNFNFESLLIKDGVSLFDDKINLSFGKERSEGLVIKDTFFTKIAIIMPTTKKKSKTFRMR